MALIPDGENDYTSRAEVERALNRGETFVDEETHARTDRTTLEEGGVRGVVVLYANLSRTASFTFLAGDWRAS